MRRNGEESRKLPSDPEMDGGLSSTRVSAAMTSSDRPILPTGGFIDLIRRWACSQRMHGGCTGGLHLAAGSGWLAPVCASGHMEPNSAVPPNASQSTPAQTNPLACRPLRRVVSPVRFPSLVVQLRCCVLVPSSSLKTFLLSTAAASSTPSLRLHSPYTCSTKQLHSFAACLHPLFLQAEPCISDHPADLRGFAPRQEVGRPLDAGPHSIRTSRTQMGETALQNPALNCRLESGADFCLSSTFARRRPRRPAIFASRYAWSHSL